MEFKRHGVFVSETIKKNFHTRKKNYKPSRKLLKGNFTFSEFASRDFPLWDVWKGDGKRNLTCSSKASQRKKSLAIYQNYSDLDPSRISFCESFFALEKHQKLWRSDSWWLIEAKSNSIVRNTTWKCWREGKIGFISKVWWVMAFDSACIMAFSTWWDRLGR